MGHPNCLKGKTFVITGTLDSLYRNEAEDYIKRHSGRVTGSVSGKTTFLLVGENSGNSKVNQVCGYLLLCVPVCRHCCLVSLELLDSRVPELMLVCAGAREGYKADR